jgi:hypothetical protein
MMFYQAVVEAGEPDPPPDPPPGLELPETVGPTIIPFELIFASQAEYSLASSCSVMGFVEID